MKNEQNQIADFMTQVQQDVPKSPTLASHEVRALRVRLIAEELMELCEALNVSLKVDNVNAHSLEVEAFEIDSRRDYRLTEAYDAILDLMVVVIGTGVALGLNLEPGWQEVHRSNMSKIGQGHKRADGKWIKGPFYSPANLAPIVTAQMQETSATPQT